MTERTPLDTTSPLALDKRLFEGEFFFKQTIVDLPYAVDYSFVGESNDLRIIRWEITQNWLIAYDIHEKIESTNTDGQYDMNKVPVLAYPIRAHYDIRYAENTTTGEDLPVIVANTDKPWWQRRYFEVDVSSNAINIPFDMKYMKITIDLSNPFSMTPVAGYRNMEFHDGYEAAIDARNYNSRYAASHSANGDPKLGVDTISWESELILTANNSWRGIYTWEDVMEFINWDPARITLRNFFWKVDRDELNNNGFEAMEFQDDMFRRFGYFTREYRGVDLHAGYRENYHHQWANYYNITGDNKIVYYLSPNFPERMTLTACSIAADYNWAFSKVSYEGERAKALWEDQRVGFQTDFPDQIKLADGLYEIGSTEAGNPTSAFMPDAAEAWPENMQLEDDKYYYLDYNLETLQPPNAWSEGDSAKVEAFTSRQSKMVAEMKRYCFTEDENDKFVLRRNEFLEYDPIRDGYNPEGVANGIPREQIYEIYGEDVESRVASAVPEVVACKLDLQRRCLEDSEGNPIPRWKHELGDGRKSFIYWVDTPTEYGILGVAQWSDNPETGQIFGGVGHIAGSVLQWSVTRELERYYMLSELKEVGLNPTAERYEELLNDLVIDTEQGRLPESGEEGARPYTDEGETAPKSAPMPGSQGWYLSALHSPKMDVRNMLTTNGPTRNAFSKPGVSDLESGSFDAERLRQLQDKHLPPMEGRLNLNAIAGTQWESQMAPKGLLDYIYPDQTSFNEEMLWMISPLYWGTPERMKHLADMETELTKGCYFQPEWVDGGYLEFIKKLDDAGYSRADIRLAVERIMFKGVAEHELGHALGLRHNFRASADELNYVGNKKQGTGYWAFKKDYEDALAQKVSQYAEEKGIAVSQVAPIEKFYLGKTISSPMEWYMYSSVMDYMDEFFYHGFGLGNYDVSAFRYVYGKAQEKYKLNGNSVEQHIATKDPEYIIEPLFETRFCTANDVYNNACACTPGDPKDGMRDEDCTCTDVSGMTYCFNRMQTIDGLRYETPVKIETDPYGKMSVVPDESQTGMIGTQLNGDVKPYLYCPDNYRWDDPMCNVWDKGYTARDIIRNMSDQYKRFYHWRFFRRGNPKFRRTSWWYSIMRFYPFAHFALDYNFWQFKDPEWRKGLVDSTPTPFPTTEDGELAEISMARKEYLLAINGIEEWTNPVTQRRETLTPGGPGDYLIAGMEGMNFLVYDVMYSPDVGTHVLSSWKDDSSVQYFLDNPYIYEDSELETELGMPVLEVDLRYGHHHRNHWDRQDDWGITQSRLTRRGFTNEKDAAMFVLANSGWWDEKYSMESMANAFSYVSDGMENTVYQLMADMLNEDSMTTFSPYCAVANENNGYDLRVYRPRTSELFLWNWTDDFSGSYLPQASKADRSMCQKLQEQDANGNVYIPVHASWVYYDSMFPAFWAIYNQSNIMADNTVWNYYYVWSVPVYERDTWEPVDNTPECVETLNDKENMYYRACRFANDDRPNPAYRMVKRYKHIMDQCIIDEAEGHQPGNFETDTCNGGYPRWYLRRDMEYIESKIVMLQSYGNFWSNVAGLFF